MIRPAFQSLHTSGPVAAASATVSACSRSSSSADPPTASPTVCDRQRIVEVAAGRGVGQQQVVAHERGDRRRVAVGQPHPVGDPLGDHRARDRVVALRVALADVVQQRAEQQQIRAGRPGGSAPAAWAAVSIRCRSTVNRCTGLCWILKRTVSHSGISRLEHAGLVEGLEHRHRPRARAQQRDELGERGRRPRRRHRRALGRQPFEGERRHRQVLLGGDPGGPQRPAAGRPTGRRRGPARSRRPGRRPPRPARPAAARRRPARRAERPEQPRAAGRATGGRLAATRRQALVSGERDRPGGDVDLRAARRRRRPARAGRPGSPAPAGAARPRRGRSGAAARRGCRAGPTRAARTATGTSTSWAAASADSVWASRSPPLESLRLGSSRKAPSPASVPALLGQLAQLVDPLGRARPPQVIDPVAQRARTRRRRRRCGAGRAGRAAP